MDPVTATAALSTTATAAAGIAATATATAATATATAVAAVGAFFEGPPRTVLEVASAFGTALAVGAIIGVERERTRLHGHEPAASMPGGFRTFPLVALLGCALAWLGDHVGPGVLAAGVLGFSALVVAVYVLTSLKGDLSVTTEVALSFTFTLGIVAYVDHGILAPALGVLATIILSLRDRLHDMARRIDEEDLFGALKLAAVTVIVLPLLPNEGMGPYSIWNPYKIWLLVVFISAIAFAGYVGVKLLGPGRGIALAGLLGGVASSTAATLSFAGRSKEDPALSRDCALAIALAWSTMYVRVVISVAVVAPSLVRLVVIPIAAMGAAGIIAAFLLVIRAHHAEAAQSGTTNYKSPFRIMPAVKFGLLFAAVLLVAKAAQEAFSSAGLYVAAGLTGLFDVDAITLTAARLASENLIVPAFAANTVFIAIAANTLMKAGMASSLGAPALRKAILGIAAVSLAAGGAAVWVTRAG